MIATVILEGLRSSELFGLLNEEQIKTLTASLANACNIEEYKAGDHIFDQGELSSKLYVVVSGQVMLQRSHNIGDKPAAWPLGVLGKGRGMGWSSMLYGPRYATASAICQKAARLIAIDGNTLRAMLEEHPEIGFKVLDRLASMLGERLRAAYNTMEAHL
jgi:CRP-like cAMP-binding protein